MGPLPSTGLPRASTARPRSALPTGTERSLPVVWTSSPSFSFEISPSTTQPTSSSSRLSAMPMAPPGHCTISLYITSERPSIFATPSATARMWPVFFLTALVESLAICCSIWSRTELIGERFWERTYQEILDGGGEGRELARNGRFVNIVAHAH